MPVVVVSPVDQSTAEYNLHTIVPGYVAIGAVAVLFVLFALFVVVVAIKVFRVRSQSQKENHPNLNAYEYPTIKNDYTVSPDEHIGSSV